MASELSPLMQLITTAQQAERDHQLDRAASTWSEVRRHFPQEPAGYGSGGWVLKRLGQLSEAAFVLDQGLTKFPGDEWLPLARAWTAIEQGDLPRASELFRAVRERNPRNLQGYLGEAVASRSAGAHGEAEAVYRDALIVFPANAELWTELAWTAEERRDTDEALRIWQIVRDRFPNVSQAYVRAGVILRDSQRWDEADLMLEQAIDRFPNDREAWLSYAWAAHQRRDWPKALRRWESIVARFPQLSDGRTGAAQALMEMDRLSEATQVLMPALRMFPNNQVVMRLNGWLATRRRDITEAERNWTRLRELFPGDIDGYFGCAIALRDVGRLDEADAMLKWATVTFPTNEPAAIDFAQIAMRRRNWPLAIQRWRDIIGRFPDLPHAYVGLGESLHQAGDASGAEAIFRAGRGKFPDDISIRAAEAGVAAGERNWPLAIQLWTALLETFPNEATGHVGLGRTLREFGDFDRSEQRLNFALKLFPNHIQLAVQLALTISWKREWPKALALWSSLRERWPDNTDVRWGISQVLTQARNDQEASWPVPFKIPDSLIANEASEPIQIMGALLKRFESLGADCEFAMIQRIFQVDLPSLLRWATTSPDDLVKALASRFDGVGEPANTIIEVQGDEYTSQDRRFFMRSHTFTPPSTEPIEQFTMEHCQRIQWLRRKLVDDLTAAKRIFVYKYKSGITDSQVKALHASLCCYNPAIILLCVRLQTQDCASGTLQKCREGLFIGYIDRFSTVDMSVGVWTSLCQQLAAHLGTRTERETSTLG